jgi:hypothetical protein
MAEVKPEVQQNGTAKPDPDVMDAVLTEEAPASVNGTSVEAVDQKQSSDAANALAPVEDGAKTEAQVPNKQKESRSNQKFNKKSSRNVISDPMSQGVTDDPQEIRKQVCLQCWWPAAHCIRLSSISAIQIWPMTNSFSSK